MLAQSARFFSNTNNANVTPVTVSGTTSQTVLQSFTLPAAELNTAGRWITARARGFVSAGTTPGTLTLSLKLGSTALFTTSAVNLAASSTNIAWLFEADIMTQTTGATGALEVQGNETITGQTNFAFGNTATVTGIDLTASQTLSLFCTTSQSTTSCISRMMGYQRNN